MATSLEVYNKIYYSKTINSYYRHHNPYIIKELTTLEPPYYGILCGRKHSTNIKNKVKEGVFVKVSSKTSMETTISNSIVYNPIALVLDYKMKCHQYNGR